MKNSMDCPCGKTARYAKHLRFNKQDIDGWKCDSCGEVYYNPEKAEKILILNKLRKHSFRLKLTQVKSNLILRIPKEVSDSLNLRAGEEVLFNLRHGNEMVVRKG